VERWEKIENVLLRLKIKGTPNGTFSIIWGSDIASREKTFSSGMCPSTDPCRTPLPVTLKKTSLFLLSVLCHVSVHFNNNKLYSYGISHVLKHVKVHHRSGIKQNKAIFGQIARSLSKLVGFKTYLQGKNTGRKTNKYWEEIPEQT